MNQVLCKDYPKRHIGVMVAVNGIRHITEQENKNVSVDTLNQLQKTAPQVTGAMMGEV